MQHKSENINAQQYVVKYHMEKKLNKTRNLVVIFRKKVNHHVLCNLKTKINLNTDKLLHISFNVYFIIAKTA